MNDHAQDLVLGAIASKELDDLSKELERKQEEQRLYVVAQLAAKEKAERDASEARRKGLLSHIRDVENEVFHQLLIDKQSTIDSFLEEILATTVSGASRRRAYLEAQAQAERLNQTVEALDKTDPHACVKTLVEQLVFPQSQRHVIRKQVESESKRFIEAARASLDSAMENVHSKMAEARARKEAEQAEEGQ